MDRRQFLFALAATVPALTLGGKVFAAPATSPRFLLVFLRGGYDANNLLVPYGSDFYYESRPHIALAKPTPGDPKSVRALDANWGLAPAVAQSMGPLWDKKQLAFIPFAGTDDLSRSHFETQDNIESGEAGDARQYASGFMGRLSGVLRGVPPIAFTDALPLSFRGTGDVPNISLKGSGKAVFDDRQSKILAGMYEGTPLQAAATDGLQLRQQVAQDLQTEMVAASRGAVNARGFAQQGQRMATLMKDRFRLGFVDVGGWDTHVNQGGADGLLANNLDNLSQGLAAFADGLGEAEWNNTVVVVVSEFGRTFRENGNKGTDHGHGTTYWVLGGKINGGRVAGNQVAINAGSLLQNRDYPVLNNYRDVLGGLMKRMYGLSDTDVGNVFPSAKPKDLQLV
ncbi:DUF1501 domain-containing protein [Luteibacter yeojuensis]|uniref:DUF1501 domain-containing protein n=1 Tax=Luteibacter yeojuensis TaxID=345309 RepID=A0A0F3KCE2_9GAMM|nr:DUF1501 domain-containing protein [Luteibacter yeojuensis]KJV27774.1 hypothetical protein VI08_17565 [Luteibacter yeojuensis]